MAARRGLDQAAFAHNVAMVQDGSCFTLLHHGTAAAPSSFEQGVGEQTLRTWFWPMGGELVGDTLYVFWAQMRRTADPGPGDGLGWDPVVTWLAAYDADSLARTSFQRAPDAGVHPIYGYAVASDDDHTYLFGNSFDQNLADQGGFFGGPHSARLVYLARVPRGRLDERPEYWTGSGWSAAGAAATPISDRFSPENPMQPRYLDGQWVAATKVGGYWGEELAIDVAAQPWGPWQTVVRRPLAPRGADPLMNTYHAHLMPWLSGGGLVVSVSQNARDMLAHAWPRPERYRPQFTTSPLVRPRPVEATRRPRPRRRRRHDDDLVAHDDDLVVHARRRTSTSRRRSRRRRPPHRRRRPTRRRTRLRPRARHRHRGRTARRRRQHVVHLQHADQLDHVDVDVDAPDVVGGVLAVTARRRGSPRIRCGRTGS